jgi:hypothetical protein
MSKQPCNKCQKEFNIKTLSINGRDGNCGKCFNSTNGITKKNIPKILKDAVWKKYIGNKLIGECYVCKKEITATSFHAGHINSEYSGGDTTFNNLRPTCKKCNTSTGVFNMEEIKNSLIEIEEKTCLICKCQFKKGSGGKKICEWSTNITEWEYMCKKCDELPFYSYAKTNGISNFINKIKSKSPRYGPIGNRLDQHSRSGLFGSGLSYSSMNY